MKIFITGRAGGGKSTLARKLAQQHHLHHYETDILAYDEKANRMKTDAELDKVINISQDNWIIEGAYIIPKYIKAADKVIYVKPEIVKSLYRILKRYFTTPSVRKQYSFFNTLRLCKTTIEDEFRKSSMKAENIKSGFYTEVDRLAIVKTLAKKIEFVK